MICLYVEYDDDDDNYVDEDEDADECSQMLDEW